MARLEELGLRALLPKLWGPQGGGAAAAVHVADIAAAFTAPAARWCSWWIQHRQFRHVPESLLPGPWSLKQQRIRLQCRRPGFHPWVRKIPLEKGMATHCSILAWRIPWTKESGGPQSMGSQRSGHDPVAHTAPEEETVSFTFSAPVSQACLSWAEPKSYREPFPLVRYEQVHFWAFHFLCWEYIKIENRI